tara:strand:- start:190 stop:513 length:324 start_codon:yes stop_codon:yes gene_type:complete
MPVSTTVDGSTFYNRNQCRSFKQTVSTSLTQLSATICSEVIIVNRTPGDILIYDNDNASEENSFLLATGESFTFRGLTNTCVVSTIALSAGDIYYRSQYFSFSNSNA